MTWEGQGLYWGLTFLGLIFSYDNYLLTESEVITGKTSNRDLAVLTEQ